MTRKYDNDRPVSIGALPPKARYLIGEYRRSHSQITQRQRAEHERQIWDAAKSEERSWHRRGYFFQKLFGKDVCTAHDIHRRSQLLGWGSAANLLWARIEDPDEKMSLTTASNLYLTARKRLDEGRYPVGTSFREALLMELQIYETSSVVRTSSKGRTYRVKRTSRLPDFADVRAAKKKSSEPPLENATSNNSDDNGSNAVAGKRAWNVVREIVSEQIVNRIGEDADPFLVEQLYREFEHELKALIDTFSERVHSRRRAAQERRLLTDRTIRKHVKEALNLFGMDMPRRGQVFDVKLFRRRYRRVVKEYHPDRNPGNEDAMRQQFQAVTDAYERIMQWHQSNTSDSASSSSQPKAS